MKRLVAAVTVALGLAVFGGQLALASSPPAWCSTTKAHRADAYFDTHYPNSRADNYIDTNCGY